MRGKRLLVTADTNALPEFGFALKNAEISRERGSDARLDPRIRGTDRRRGRGGLARRLSHGCEPESLLLRGWHSEDGGESVSLVLFYSFFFSVDGRVKQFR